MLTKKGYESEFFNKYEKKSVLNKNTISFKVKIGNLSFSLSLSLFFFYCFLFGKGPDDKYFRLFVP